MQLFQGFGQVKSHHTLEDTFRLIDAMIDQDVKDVITDKPFLGDIHSFTTHRGIHKLFDPIYILNYDTDETGTTIHLKADACKLLNNSIYSLIAIITLIIAIVFTQLFVNWAFALVIIVVSFEFIVAMIALIIGLKYYFKNSYKKTLELLKHHL